MKKISLYQKVKLITNKYIDEGLKKDMIGIVLEKYNDEYFEIEWHDNRGNSIACFAFHINDFEAIN